MTYKYKRMNSVYINSCIVAIAIVIGALIYSSCHLRHESKTHIRKSDRGGMHGRGVFSNGTIEPNETIETGPLLVSNEDDSKEACAMCSDYIWSYSGHASSELYKYAVPLGSASICNHSNNPNANVKFQDKNYTLFAIRPIHAGDEILVSYCQGKKTCLWGVGRNIKLIE